MHQNAAQIGNSYLLNLQSSCWSLVSGAASWKSIMMFNILWFQAPMSFCCFFNHSVGWWVVWESEVTILPAHPDVSHVSHNHSTSADTGDEKIGLTLSRNAAEDHPTWISNISWKKSHVPDLHLKDAPCKFANCNIYNGARILFIIQYLL